MIKVEVIKPFSLGKFNELKNVVRKSTSSGNTLNTGDTFECTKEMCDYLMGNNKVNDTFVKIIEVIPEEEPKVEIEKPKKTIKKKSKK